MASDHVVSVILKAQTGTFKRDMNDAAQSTERFGSAAEPAAKSTSSLADKAIKLAGYSYAVKKGFDATVGAAISWESAFAGVEKTVNGTTAELAAIEDGLRAMSKEIPTSADELANIAASAGQLGIETPNVLGFTRVIADLGETTNLTGEQAATSLARLANITGMSQQDFDRLGSTVVDLGNNLATTESEIVEFGLRLAGAGSQVGMTEPQILALGAALSSVGINAEAGGTAVSKVMIEIASEVENGGEKLETFARVAGMSAEEFSTAWREDAAGALVSFITGLGDTEAQGMSTLAILEELGITEARMRDALLRTSSASDVLNSSLAIGTGAWEENNALTQEAAVRYDTAESNISELGNTLTDLGRTIGQEVLPQLSEATSSLNDFLNVERNQVSMAESMARGFMSMIPGLGGVKSGTDDAADSTEDLSRVMDSTMAAAARHASGMDDVTEAHVDAGAQIDDTITSLEGLADSLRAGTDPVFAASKSLRDLDEIMKDTEASSEDVADQALRTQSDLLTLAEAVENGSASVYGLERQFQMLVDQGMIPQKIADDVLSRLTDVVATAEETGVSVVEALNLHNELDAAGRHSMDGYIAGLGAMSSQAIAEARRIAEATHHTVRDVLKMRSPSRVFYELGEDTVAGYILGLEDGADDVEAAVRGIIDQAMSGVDAIMGGIGALGGRESAQGRVDRLTAELEALEARQAALPGLIGGARRDVYAARRRAQEITPAEEAAILRARERLTRAEADLATAREEGELTADQLRLMELDVTLAQEALTQAEQDAIGPTRELEQAQRALAELEQERATITADLEAARESLYQAQLKAIDAEAQLLEAGQALIDQGPEGEELFRALAEKAGLTKDVIDGLIASYRELAEVATGQMTATTSQVTSSRDALLRAALEKAGVNYGGRVDPADIAAGLRAIGHDYGGRVDPEDEAVLLRFGGGRASGGRVDPAHWYTVGEHGPETFVPDRPGTIMPAGAAPTVQVFLGDEDITSMMTVKVVQATGMDRVPMARYR